MSRGRPRPRGRDAETGRRPVRHVPRPDSCGELSTRAVGQAAEGACPTRVTSARSLGLSSGVAAHVTRCGHAPEPLELVYVDGLGALGSSLLLIGDLASLGERAVAVGGDARVMDEEVATTVIRGDEAEPLLIAEPFDRASWHVECSSALKCCCRGGNLPRRLHLLGAARSTGRPYKLGRYRTWKIRCHSA